MSDNNGTRQGGAQPYSGFDFNSFGGGFSSPSGGAAGYMAEQSPQRNNTMGAGAGGPPPNANETDTGFGAPIPVGNREQPVAGVNPFQFPQTPTASIGGGFKPMQAPAQPTMNLPSGGGMNVGNVPSGGFNWQSLMSAMSQPQTPAPAITAPSVSAGGGGMNPNFQAQAQSIMDMQNRNLRENALQSVRDQALMTGQYGGDRQGLAEGVAIRGADEATRSALANLYGQQYESQANRDLQSSLANAQMQMQAQLAQMQDSRAGQSMDLQRMLGLGNLGLNAQQAQTARELGFGNLDLNRDQANTQRLLGLGNLGLGFGNLGLSRENAQNNFYSTQRGQDLDQMRLAAALTGQGQQGLLGGMGSLFGSYQGQNNADRDQLSWYSSLFGPFMGANSTQTGQQGYTYNPTMQWLGTGAQLASAFRFSDRRLKENIKKVGKTDDGLKVYTYNYKGDSTPQMGVMAQEVEKKKPEAVTTHESGFKMVNYGLLGA